MHKISFETLKGVDSVIHNIERRVDQRYPKPSLNLKPPLCITRIINLKYIVAVVLGLVMVLGITTTTTMYNMHTFVVSTCMQVV